MKNMKSIINNMKILKQRRLLLDIKEDLKSLTRKVDLLNINKVYESYDLNKYSEIDAAQTSAAYYNQYLYDKTQHCTNLDLLTHCCNFTEKKIFALEFGVFSGATINHIASHPNVEVIYGFDSFEGLPEKWRDGFEKGNFKVTTQPEVSPNVSLVQGLFADTLPDFFELQKGPFNFIHIDCDLYSSTKTALDQLLPYLAEKTVIVFDEYFNYPGWKQHEYKAFQEFVEKNNLVYEYIGCVPTHQQVAVCLTC